MYWDEFSEEFPVAEGCAVGTVNLHQVLVVLANFHDHARFVPFQGVQAGLVLDTDMIADLEGGKRLVCSDKRS